NPLHLTHKTSINVGTAVYVAMLLILPWQLPGLLALIGSFGALIWRMRSDSALTVSEPAFNAGQSALYVAAGGLSIAALNAFFERTTGGAPNEIVVLIVASAVLHLTNAGFVSVVAALQM